MFCIKIWGSVETNFYKLFFGAGAGQSRDFLSGAGADIFYPEPKKMARLRNTGVITPLLTWNYLSDHGV